VSENAREAAGDSVGPSALREASLTGVRWSTMTRFFAELISFGGSIVLAHLITPAEFGLAAVALGFAAIGPSVAGAGFGVPLVQMRTLERAHIQAALVLSVVTGLGLTLATIFVISPFAIEPVFGSRVAYLLVLVSPTFALAGIGTIPNALLQRTLRFRRLSEIEIVSIATVPVTSIILAATLSLGAEAIVLGGVASSVISTFLTVVSAPRVSPRWDRAYARDVAGVGVFAALSSLVSSLSRNVHYAILGARLPALDVGLFWRAYQLAVDYQAKVGLIAIRLAFPLFSRSGGLEEMRYLRSRILQVQSIVIFPLLATLIALAPEVVPFVYGSDWKEAAVPVQILAIAGMATIAASAGIPLAFAAGKGRQLFYFNLAQLVGFVTVVFWSSSYGLRVVAVGIAAYQILALAAQFVYLESREVGIPLRETWAPLVPAFVASSAALAVSYPAVRLLSLKLHDVALILVGGVVSVGLYAIVLRIVFPSSWRAVHKLFIALARPGAGSTAGTAVPLEQPAGNPEKTRSG
jgi:O-antigen/teichoic acid export membrane protein